MKIAGIREVRERTAAYLGGDEPVLVTRHGKISGLFLPLDDPTRMPEDLRRELAGVLGRHLGRLLEADGVSEREVQEEFDAHRRSRR